MVEGAGVNPKTSDRLSPRALDGMVHQEAPGAPPNETWHDAEECQLAHALYAKIQFQQSFILGAAAQRVDLNLRITNNPLQRWRIKVEAREPKPVLTNAPVLLAVPVS